MTNLLVRHAIATLESVQPRVKRPEGYVVKEPDDCVQVARIVMAKRASANLFWRSVHRALEDFSRDNHTLFDIPPETFYGKHAAGISEYLTIFVDMLSDRVHDSLIVAAIKIIEEVNIARATGRVA